uniref:Uncharacterized protein n=1 Tax=Molossus molossus TaxID=27622 RepID=A0A7J8I058_MOLMO|nr:hypothetical protein HJG59_010839 [Molossus molossus]
MAQVLQMEGREWCSQQQVHHEHWCENEHATVRDSEMLDELRMEGLLGSQGLQYQLRNILKVLFPKHVLERSRCRHRLKREQKGREKPCFANELSAKLLAAVSTEPLCTSGKKEQHTTRACFFDMINSEVLSLADEEDGDITNDVKESQRAEACCRAVERMDGREQQHMDRRLWVLCTTNAQESVRLELKA